MSQLEEWLQSLMAFGYPGVFLLSFIGASSVIIPVPYTVVLLAIALSGQFNPLLLALSSGIGSAAGELAGYGLGYVGRRFVGRRYEARFAALMKLYDRYGMVVVFLFALTPLPDDLLFIPLGLLRYSLWRAFIPMILGKLSMCSIIVYVGHYASDIILKLYGGESLIGSIIVTVLLFLTVFAMLRVDWEKVLERYLSKKESEKKMDD